MKTQELIKVKEGYSFNYLPSSVSYKNYTMLVAIANYSENEICRDRARFYLDEDNLVKDKEFMMENEGGFMTSVCFGDFTRAYRNADGSNRKALIKGLETNTIEL